MNYSLTYDDVLLVPGYNHYESRRDVDIMSSDRSGKLTLDLPVMSSNMDTITAWQMAQFMSNKGGIGVLHRFMSVDDNVAQFRLLNENQNDLSPSHKCFISIGISERELERAEALRDAGAEFFCIDIAHGHCKLMGKQLVRLRELVGDSACIMAGNVATLAGADYLASKGADIIKAGIGGGCYAGDTRILMANGTYKDIKDIKLHDRVINRHGSVVEVIGTKFSGFKDVVKYKSNIFYKETVCTPDHRHWVGDYGGNKKAASSTGMAKALSKKDREGNGKFKWMRIDDAKDNGVLLMPKNISFEMLPSFEFSLDDYTLSRRDLTSFKQHAIVKQSYELGYIFGTYLGDGHAKVYHSTRTDKDGNKKRNTSSDTMWYFGKNEIDIAKKVVTYLSTVFGISAKIEAKKNMTTVVVRCNSLSRMLIEFGKKQDKHLPDKFYCSDKEYVRGILDGLIDSYSKDNRICFDNTSNRLLELFGVVFYLTHGYFPSMQHRKKTTGGLDVNIENCNEQYGARSVGSPDKNNVHSYQINKINSYYEWEKVYVPTYDIQVDCPTSSFIANNAITHNSVCTTRIKTAHGVPNFSMLLDVCRVGRSVVADGGLRNSGDIVKALGAGADFVMIGGMLAGTRPTPGEVETLPIDTGGTIMLKSYRGMASKETADDKLGGLTVWKTAEGVSTTVPYREDEDEIIADIVGGLRSGMTYSGSATIKELQRKLNYVVVTAAGRAESLPHKESK